MIGRIIASGCAVRLPLYDYVIVPPTSDRCRCRSRQLAKAVVAVLGAAAIANGTTAGSTPPPAPDRWTGDFETGNLSQWSAVQESGPDRIRLVTDIVREGRYAARFEVRPNDFAAGPSGERAEVLLANTRDSPGQEWYYAWSTYFPSDFVSDPGWKHMFVQWKGPDPRAAASVSFQVSGQRLVVRVGNAYTPTKWAQYDLGPLVRGAWQDFIFHVRWEPNATGFVEIWRNGKLVVPKRYHLNVPPGASNYLKLGFYRDRANHPTVVYHDGMRRGRTLGQVTGNFKLAFTARPTLSPGRTLIVHGSSFAGARIRVVVSGSQGTRVVGALRADAGGRIAGGLKVPPRIGRPRHVTMRAQVSKKLGPAMRFASAPIRG